MDLAKELKKSGFKAAKKELDEIKGIREALWNDLQLNAATIDLVDRTNDLELEMLDVKERAEMVLGYVENELPDQPATAEIRNLLEKSRNNEE